MKQIAYHHAGNYCLQLIIAVAGVARTIVTAPGCSLDPTVARSLAGLFPTILGNLARDYADMSQHEKASHVLDKLMEYALPQEILDIADEVGQSGCQLLANKWGHKFLQRLLDRLVRRCLCCPFSCPGASSSECAAVRGTSVTLNV